MKDKYLLTRRGCYVSNVSMSIVAMLSPLLFVTFHDIYGISYTLLGLLVAVNFTVQLAIDFIFTFFSKYFNIHKTIRTMPLLSFVGFIAYGLFPLIYPAYSYVFLMLGTVIFSISSGLNEVLISALIAAIPSENPEKEMSNLHSSYAWGVVGVVIISTLFLYFLGRENWQYLALMWSVVPFLGFLMFSKAELPEMNVQGEKSEGTSMRGEIILCFFCIFMGGAAECTLAQWSSGYIEKCVGLSKIWGDIAGVALFSLLLGVGRTLYGKYGKHILNVMLCGMIGATICYLIASLSLSSMVGLIACVITGLCVSMLWPGTLIHVGERMKNAGVYIYALMAAGGDMGAAIGPQLMGIISDKLSGIPQAAEIAESFNITVEQLGMRGGLLFCTIFPIIGIIIVALLKMSAGKSFKVLK